MQRLIVYPKLVAASLIGRARKSVLGAGTLAVVSATDNGIFATDPVDMGVGRELRNTGAYGQNELSRVFAHVGKDDDVLVVGAHVGSLVVPIARQCRNVVAIEANPDTFRLLELNLLLNKSDNVRACHLAASNKTETLEFVSSRSNSGGAKRMPKVRAFEYFYDSPQTISVEARALDEHLAGRRFGLVFMDIEGSEYFALGGMQAILRDARTLFIEYLPHHLRNVAGVTPAEFLALIAPHFAHLYIPSKNLRVEKDGFLPALQDMFDRDEGDDGLIFTK